MTLWRVALLLTVGLFDVLLFGKMIWGPGGFVEYRELKSQRAAIMDEIASLDASNLALSRDIRLLQTDDKYMEKMVRQKLRYLRDNEVVYIFPAKRDERNGASGHDSEN